jgi:CheY-like chemotaxis protein
MVEALMVKKSLSLHQKYLLFPEFQLYTARLSEFHASRWRDICVLKKVGFIEMIKSTNSSSTILLVDDEPDVRQILSLALEMEGFTTLQAENGYQAIQILMTVTRLPSVIVLDLSMPILDGRGFLDRRAQDLILAKIPVIVVSGSSRPAQALPGIERFLQKPVELTQLVEMIGQLMK